MGSNTININDGVETKTLDLEVLDSPPPVPSSGYTRIFNESGSYQSIDSDGIITPIAGSSGATPTGSLIAYAGISAPEGWLLCFGQSVSRIDYADLFTALGVTYGAGDGSTTFNLPDLRGRTLAGKDNMGGVAANRLTSAVAGSTLGASGGSQSHTLSTGEMPNHSHNLYISNPAGTGTPIVPISYTSISNSLSQIAAISAAGSGGSHNNTQPTLIVNYIIKT